ncbi:hypothetical protein J6W34_02815 [bacterium]|nr:hypothetical protein [bacterium]
MEENTNNSKRKIAIGLDLGVASCGFCCMDISNYENPIIENIGVRLFEENVDPKTKTSYAKIRRKFRSLRRSVRRIKFKKEQLIKLFVKYNFLNIYI